MFILVLLSRFKKFMPVMAVLIPWIVGFSVSPPAIFGNVRQERENAYHILKSAVLVYKRLHLNFGLLLIFFFMKSSKH